MTWVKIDDLITEHPKFVGLSDAAWTIWIHGLTYAGRNLSDGLIPSGMLNRLCNTKRPTQAAAELVASGLWDETPEGWMIHDYLEHQRSSDVKAKHKAASSAGAQQANHNRWHVRPGKFDPGCQFCVSATDRPLTDSESVDGQQSKRDIEKKEIPTREHHQQPVERGSSPADGGESQATTTTVDTAIGLIADYQLSIAIAQGKEFERGRTAYRSGIVQRLINAERTWLTAAAEEHPDWTAAELRDWHLELEASNAR